MKFDDLEHIYPFVSIKIVTYNRVNLLKRCLQSLICQTYKNFEIIIFDDNSTDNTKSYCESIINNRIFYFRNDSNVGAVENFRRALRYKSGDFTMVIADDDYLSPDYINQCICFLLNNPNFTFVKGITSWVDNGQYSLTSVRNLDSNNNFRRIKKYYSDPGEYTLLYSMYSTKIINNIYIYDLAPFDWHLEASMAYLGKFKTIDTVILYRSAIGVSSSKIELFHFLKFTSYKKYLPYTIISFNSALHFIRNPIFKEINILCRIFKSIFIMTHCFYHYVIIHSSKIKLRFIIFKLKTLFGHS